MLQRFLLSKEQTPCSNDKTAAIILQEERLKSFNYFFQSHFRPVKLFLEHKVQIED